MTGGDYYYATPFEIEAKLAEGIPKSIEFVADDVVNWRWHTNEGRIQIALSPAD